MIHKEYVSLSSCSIDSVQVKQMGAAAREWAVKHFDAKQVADSIRQRLSECMFWVASDVVSSNNAVPQSLYRCP